MGLSGPTKSGKTTAALEVARYFREREHFSGGIYFVSLQGVCDDFAAAVDVGDSPASGDGAQGDMPAIDAMEATRWGFSAGENLEAMIFQRCVPSQESQTHVPSILSKAVLRIRSCICAGILRHLGRLARLRRLASGKAQNINAQLLRWVSNLRRMLKCHDLRTLATEVHEIANSGGVLLIFDIPEQAGGGEGVGARTAASLADPSGGDEGRAVLGGTDWDAAIESAGDRKLDTDPD